MLQIYPSRILFQPDMDSPCRCPSLRQGELGLKQLNLGEGVHLCVMVSGTPNASVARSSHPLALVAQSHGPKGPSLACFVACQLSPEEAMGRATLGMG